MGEGADVRNGCGRYDGLGTQAFHLAQGFLEVFDRHVERDVWRRNVLVLEDAAINATLAAGTDDPVIHEFLLFDLPVEEVGVELLQPLGVVGA